MTELADRLGWTAVLSAGMEAKALRHGLLPVAGRVARSGRRVFLRLQRSWRWASMLAAAFRRRLRSLPAT